MMAIYSVSVKSHKGKRMNASKMAKIFLLVVAVIAVIAAIPLILIWSVNTLFATGIEYTVWTWLAALVLGSLIGQSAAR